MSKQEAERECRTCRGREHGDCDPACQFWHWTATDAEKEQAKRGPGVWLRTKRKWRGPVFHGEDHEASLD